MQSQNIGSISAGGMTGMALDAGNQLIWFRNVPTGNWNGSGTANPATGTGGISITPIATGPLYALYSTTGNAGSTVNFGASAFAGAVPAGFCRLTWPNARTAAHTGVVHPTAGGARPEPDPPGKAEHDGMG